MTCQCAKCLPYSIFNPIANRMILCKKCGCKRCPHAEWHGYECTDSNKPNQIGFVSDESVKLMNGIRNDS